MNELSSNLILASKSPRRKELLQNCGVDFSVKTAPVTELTSFEPLSLLPQENALIKAMAVAEKEADSWVLGADTMIIFDGRAIGKPESISDAFEMLSRFSGRTHEVISGLTLVNKKKNITLSWSESSSVKFKTLTPEIIRNYLDKVEVLDKAGAYAIQEHGDMIVESYTGELENIIGLPLKKLLSLLTKYAIGGKF